MSEGAANKAKNVVKSELRRTVSAQLTKFMAQHGISSKAELSRRSGIHPSALSKAIGPSDKPELLSVPNALKLCRTMGISLDFIYGNANEENVQESLIKTIAHHVLPSIHFAKLHDSTYPIHAITLSPGFLKYCDTTWVADELAESQPETRNLLLRQAENTFLQSIRDGKVDGGVEYALIPITAIEELSKNQLETLGIYPKD